MSLPPLVHFKLSDASVSQRARALGIDNTLPEKLKPNALATLGMLEVIRAHLCAKTENEVPILVSSLYRCPALNTAVGSGPRSDHLTADASDWTAPGFGTPLQICQFLAPLVGKLGIGQLIYERPHGAARAWVHTSTRIPGKAVNRIITITEHDTLVGIVA